MDLASIIEKTKRQMAEITGLPTDTVASLNRKEEGWAIAIDMLEHKAIPRTHDLISSFEVSLDDVGNITAWRRTARFLRGQPQVEG